MLVCSTRDATEQLTLLDSLFAGLPLAGGLYHPCEPIDLRAELAALPERASFQQVATVLTESLLGAELGAQEAHSLVETAFPFAPELHWLDDELALLELFHGPTSAFKDFGAGFLAALVKTLMRRPRRDTASPTAAGDASSGLDRVLVLVATTGDTGGAVARAFWRSKGVEVIVLYPSGRVSHLQEQQLTGLGNNIHALEVAGSFDDCQRLVKAALGDRDLARAAVLCPANSISLGRLLPQAFYYIFAGLQLHDHDAASDPPVFCVPSGNLGNLTAGIYAWQWGLPVTRFIAATNRNDVVPQYLATGALAPRPSVATLSNAMDVGDPSNFERMLAVWNHDAAAMRRLVTGIAISDAETLSTIADVHTAVGRFIDPHTAVGIAAARRFRTQLAERGAEQTAPLIVLATADAAKFPEIVAHATGATPPLPQTLRSLLDRPKQATPLEASDAALRTFIEQRFLR